MDQTIPKPLAIFQNRQLLVGIEGYAAGRCLASTSGRWRGSLNQKIDDLRLASEWLGVFHQQAQVSREPWGEHQITSWLEKLLTAYSSAFDATASERSLFSEVRRRATALTGVPFLLVWQHHDFGEWNIFRDGSRINVIDWERAQIGPALSDLFWFVAHWSYTAQNLRNNAERLGCFRELFLDSTSCNATVTAIREVVVKYMNRLEIDRGFWPLLLVVTWVEHALDHVGRYRSVGEDRIDPRDGNEYVQYVSLLAEHTERLFRAPGVEAYWGATSPSFCKSVM
jgi:hypothetical protein